MDSEAILWKVVEDDLLSLVSTDQTANNGFLQDSSVGKGLSKDDKAQKLALQHWLEAEIAAASRHRYGHNLHLYYDIWIERQSTRPFFYRLDDSDDGTEKIRANVEEKKREQNSRNSIDGKEINLDKCPRSTLQRQCIKIKYLGPKSDGVEVGEEEGVLFYGVGTLQDLCEILIQILGSRNRDIRNSKQAEDHNIGEAKKGQWKTPWNENAEFETESVLVTTTSQAITALTLLQENKDKFDQVISDVLHMPDMDGFKLLELVGLEMDLPVIDGWQSRWVKSDWKRSECKAGSFKHTAGDPDYNLTLWDLIEFEQFIVHQKNFGRDSMTRSLEQLSRNESLSQEKQQKMSIHWNSLIFMGTSYQRIGRAFEATTISLYKLHTALSRNHFAAALTGSKLLTCNCQNKEQMNTKGNRVSQLDNNHESRLAVVLGIILMEDGRVQLQDNSTGCDLNNHKIIKLVLGTGETALNTAERTGNSDVEDILVEHGTVQSARAMKAQPATAIAREFKQTVSDIKHEVHHLMEALNFWAQLGDNLTLCDLINNNHKETVPRDPAVFQHHDNTFNDQHKRKKTARRVSSFVFSTVVFLGIIFDVIQVQKPLHKERDPVSMWPTLLGLFGLMLFVWAVAIMILVGSPFTRMHTAMLLFWAILMLLQSANTTGSLGILFMGWYAYALGEATTK